MADVTINQLTGQAPTNTDVFPFSTTGVTPSTYKATLAQIKTALAIPAAQIQSDWNQASSASLDFIKNKPNIQLAKAWVNFNGTTGTTVGAEFRCTIRSQYNVSKVVRTGTGLYVIHFTTSMVDINYSVGGAAFSATAGNGTKKPSTISIDGQTVSTCTIGLGYPNVYNECAFVPLNSSTICIQIFSN